jgi:hypothetical protein
MSDSYLMMLVAHVIFGIVDVNGAATDASVSDSEIPA